MQLYIPKLRDILTRYYQHILATCCQLVIVAGLCLAIMFFLINSANAATPNIAEKWHGFYFYANKKSVPFDMQIQVANGIVVGQTSEKIVSSNGSVNEKHAKISGNVQGKIISFIKTYDGNGGWSHSVEYRGDISADGTEMTGTWRLGIGRGSFTASVDTIKPTPVYTSSDTVNMEPVITTPASSHDFIFPLKGSDIELITEAGGISLDGRALQTPCGMSEPYDDPCHHSNEAFYALDFDAEAEVIAADSGDIVHVSRLSDVYQQIVIKHKDGYYSVYAEFSIKNGLSKGHVEAGSVLGVLSKKGDKKGKHLHFQVKYDPKGNGLTKGTSKKNISQLADVTIAGLHFIEYKLKRSSTASVKIQGVEQQMPLKTLWPFESQTGNSTIPPSDNHPVFYIDKGACPFECCTYRDWGTEKTTKLYSEPKLNSKVVGLIEKGVVVRAKTGEVHSTPGKIIVTRGGATFKKGDVLWVYTYLGEGFFKIWYRGKFITDFLSEGWDNFEFKPQSVWWVNIKKPSGLEGWSNQPENFSNQDACG